MFGSKLDVRHFEGRIEAYESVPVQTGKILFYGHSLFTRCSFITKLGKDNPRLEDEVRMKDGSQAIVNHGFGTSSADDLLYYYDRMVRPYKPRALVLATAANDFNAGYTPKEVMEIEARIIQWAQADFPDIKIYCFSYVPNIQYKGQKNIYTIYRKEYDQLLKDFCNQHENCRYVSLVDQPFFFERPEDVRDYDKVREDIYVQDQIHLNPQGYAYFMDFVRELLDDML